MGQFGTPVRHQSSDEYCTEEVEGSIAISLRRVAADMSVKPRSEVALSSFAAELR